MNEENVVNGTLVLPVYKWTVEIPKGGHFQFHYTELTVWRLYWMRFIGWGVKRIK